MITCVSGVTIRMSVSAVSEQGRATQGVKLIRVDEGDKIAAITKLDEKEEEVVIAEGEEIIVEGEGSIVENTAETTTETSISDDNIATEITDSE